MTTLEVFGVSPMWVGLGLAAVVTLVWIIKKNGANVTLDPTKKVRLKLIKKESLSHNVRKFRFALPSPQHTLGLPVGKHVFLSTTVDGKLLSRPYSPVSSGTKDNFMDIVLKVYFANENPKFPAGGQMSQYMDSLKEGDYVDVRGPMGKYEYAGPGTLTTKKPGNGVTTTKVKKLNMLAGGTGITPMLAIIKAILSNPHDHTQISLIFANNTEEDIFLREELESLAESHPNFSLWYVLVTPPANWTYDAGFITQEMIETHLGADADADAAYLICGPPPMVKFACLPHLKAIGVPESCILVW